MVESKWADVMFLLAVMVLIDKRIFKTEVDTFVNEASLLHEALHLKFSFSTKLAFDWFVMHRDEIISLCKSPEAEEEISERLISLKDSSECNKILKAMHQVAISDNEFHTAEVNALALAAKTWNLKLPS